MIETAGSAATPDYEDDAVVCDVSGLVSENVHQFSGGLSKGVSFVQVKSSFNAVPDFRTRDQSAQADSDDQVSTNKQRRNHSLTAILHAQAGDNRQRQQQHKEINHDRRHSTPNIQMVGTAAEPLDSLAIPVLVNRVAEEQTARDGRRATKRH